MFSNFFIKRPIFAVVIAILMVLAGTLCLTTLPVAQYPDKPRQHWTFPNKFSD